MGIKSRIILAAEVAVRQFAKTPFPHQNSAPNFDAVVPGTAGRILRRTLDFVISELCALGYLMTKIFFD